MTDVKIAKAAYCCCLREPIYTEAQLKKYGDDRAREALEMAAQVCYQNAQSTSGDEIRALAKEIE